MNAAVTSSALAAPELLPPGTLAQLFRAVEFLGAGPQGTAVLAERLDGDCSVQLLFVQPHAQSDELVERWARYQLVNHPNVISLQQVERARHDWCIVLDSPPLLSLAHALDPKDTRIAFPSWSTNVALELLKKLTSALVAAHEVGLWHGSLCLSQVRLTEQLEPRLEFSGIDIWDERSCDSASSAWLTGSREDDILQLSRVAEALLGKGLDTTELLWLREALGKADPAERPSAARVLERLTAASNARVAAQQQLSILDTVPPPDAAPSRFAAVSASASSSGSSDPTGRDRIPYSRHVGRFELNELLGEGAMGSVYRATDRANGTQVALKLLRSELLHDEEMLYRFRKEARVLEQIQSPYIANLVDADWSDGCGYIALEYVSGRALDRVLEERSEPLSESEALRLVADLCRALVEPHRKGIVHRDIKPGNVLLEGDITRLSEAQVKLCDFGIASAKLSQETIQRTREGFLLGTPQYMAPEQCKGAPVSPATDVYALGLTLFELLTGRPAFDGEDLMDILRRQVHDVPEDLAGHSNVSEGAASLVRRAIDKSAARRFADASELLQAIERVRNGTAQPQTLSATASPGSKTYSVHFHVDLRSTPEQLWPYVSNTDQMNRVVGLPPVHVERTQEDGDEPRIHLSNRVMGILQRWQEFPFEWVEGHRWSVLRVFDKGLMHWYRVWLELEPRPEGGTRLRYAMEFEPVLSILALPVKLEVGVKHRRSLSKIFRRVDDLITESRIEATPSPHASPTQASNALVRRVSEKMAALRKEGVVEPILEALTAHVLQGSEVEIARLRPLRFARSRGLDEMQLVEACLLAAREGLFELLWDVVCPLCQIPSGFTESLKQLESHAGCPACDLRFPVQFMSSVELVLRVARDVRDNEVEAYCIGGPAHSPHVAAQLRLAPGEGRVLSLQLSEGRHRIRSPQLAGVIELDVVGQQGLYRADLVIGSRLRVLPSTAAEDPRLGMVATEPVVRLGVEQQTLGLRNELDREVTVRIERTADTEDALTAARAWSFPRFRELFPQETLEAGRLAAVGELSFLALRIVDYLGLLERQGDSTALTESLRVIDPLQALAERHHGRLAALSMGLATASFERSDDALEACLELWSQLQEGSFLPCSLSLHRGPAMATTIDGRMAYFGRTLAGTWLLAEERQQLAISASAVGGHLGELRARFHRAGQFEPAPALGASEWVFRVADEPESGEVPGPRVP